MGCSSSTDTAEDSETMSNKKFLISSQQQQQRKRASSLQLPPNCLPEDIPHQPYSARTSTFNWDEVNFEEERPPSYGKIERRSSSFRWQIADFLGDELKDQEFAINCPSYLFESKSDRLITSDYLTSSKIIEKFEPNLVFKVSRIFKKQDENIVKIYAIIKNKDWNDVTHFFDINDDNITPKETLGKILKIPNEN